jgi:hypothetical protein
MEYKAYISRQLGSHPECSQTEASHTCIFGTVLTQLEKYGLTPFPLLGPQCRVH